MNKIPRLNPFAQRQIEIKESNLGRVLLFCEGPTEHYYFDYFSKIIEKNRNKYSELDIKSIPANGNAKRVFDFAENFLSNEQNARKFSAYEKNLVFDCDSPKDIQQIITLMNASPHKYNLLLTNLLFEVWLLMHFESPEYSNSNTKKKIYERLSNALGKNYRKASSGIIRQIIGNGENLKLAIKHAREIESRLFEQKLDIGHNIAEMNPYTTLHSFMNRILSEMQRAK
ncbi:RloB family protein [Paenibacillus enshidis]|uniref:RloB family protein n=1 Tax=Paenibacillus enshidis TaxID=1458439 RepID=A0ABV5B0A5_9BACL